jgi:multidrug efflux pump subunit AcrB
VLVRALRAPLLCLAGTGGIAVLSVGAALQHPGAFIPLDKSEILHIELAFPNTMSGPSRLLHIASLETELLARPDIRGVTVSVPEDVLDKSRLIVHTDGTAQAEEVVRKLVQAVPDIRSIGLKSNARPGLQLDLAASDPDTLFLAAQRVMSVIKELNEETPLVLETPVRRAEVNFLPNPAVLRQYGLDAAYVAAAVKGYASQEDHVVAVLESEERGKARTPVRIQMAATDADESVSVEDLTFAAVRLSDGGTVPLASLGGFELEFASTRIAMRDGLYVLPILVEPSSPAHARRIAAEARQEVSRLSQEMSGLRLLPAGDAETRREMMSDLGTAASSIGLLLVATLFAMFRSVTQVFVIFASLIFALSGGMLVLKLTGLPLSLPVLIGLLLLLGIVAKNAILLIDRALILSAGQTTMAQALVVAASDRARPIIMTSVAMIAGMLPAALPWLDGSAFRQPLALTVIGGVSVSTLLSLVVTPVMSLLAHRVTRRIKDLARPSALISAPQN